MRRLQALSGIDSNDRNLQMEDEAVRQDIELHQREVFGSEETDATKPSGEDEEMRILAARDVFVNQPPNQQQQSQPQPQQPTLPQPQQHQTQPAEPKKNNWLVPVLMGASIPMAALGGAGAVHWINSKQPNVDPQYEYVDETVSLGLGQASDYDWIDKK